MSSYKIYSIYLIIIFTLIKASVSNEIKQEYILSNFSDFKCNISNYITSFKSKICSDYTINSNQKFSFSLVDTKSQSHRVQCEIYSNSNLRYLEQDDKTDIESIDIETDYIPQKNNCYKTICYFEDVIIEKFKILINTDSEIKVDGLPDNIYLSTYYYENLTYNVDKCFLVKNIFKQVSKYRVNKEGNQISFLFISSIKSKVEKDETIWVEVLLQKKGNSEKKNITCISRYDAEPPIGKEEILAFYDCVIPNLDNADKYEGLIFDYSPYIKNIPINPDLKNPYKTDESIRENNMEDYSIVTFIPERLDYSECEKSGIFTITGRINGMIKDMYEFAFYLIEDVLVDCIIPEGYRQEINITCKVLNNFYNSKIDFPPCALQDNETEEILIEIMEISSNQKVTCISQPEPIESTEIVTTTLPSTYKIIPTILTTTEKIIEPIKTTQMQIDTTQELIEIHDIIKNVIFRQINNLNINSEEKIIKFNIIGFSFETNIEENMILPIDVNLVTYSSNKEFISLNCSLTNIINSSTSDVSSLTFTCIINNINDVSNYKDVIIINSDSLINIPSEDSALSSALSTNKSIEEGSLKNYYYQNNLIDIPPIITSTSLTGENCGKKGVFEISGTIDKSIDLDLSFYLKLQNPDVKVRCKISKVESNYKINIICKTFEDFNSDNLLIISKIIYDMDNNELFYLNETRATSSINCANNDEIVFSNAKKKMESFVSFRQASKFGRLDKKYIFFLATFIKKEIDINTKIYIQVEIKGSSEENLKSKTKGKVLYFRKLSRREEQTAVCTVKSKTSVNKEGLGAAGWDCSTGESSISDAGGLDILESDDLSGIPEDPSLKDPAQTDVLIESGEMTDYSIEENLNTLLPLFRTLELNYSLCRSNGSLSFKGTTTSSIENDVIFNITLTYPQVAFACKLPRSLKDQITEIECFSREEFENSTLLIEETVIRSDNTEYFILRNTSSGDRYVTCSSSDSEVSPNLYNGGFKTVTKTIKNSSSTGIGTAGIVIIVIVSVVILAGLTILFIYIKNYKKSENAKEFSDNKGIQNESTSSYF